MALCSYQHADSLVELSLSPLFHHQFSSIYKAIHDLASDALSYEKVAKKIMDFCLRYAKKQKRVRLQTDVTPVIKVHSPTLENRQYVKKSNNVIKGNKPVSIGYPLSSINLSGASKWSLPLLRARVPLIHTESSFAVEQLKALLPDLLTTLASDLVINTTDSGYTHAAYLSPLYEEEKLVCISRFRYGTKVFTPAKGDNKIGAKKIYDQCFYLRDTSRVVKGKSPKTGLPYEKEQISIYDLPGAEVQLLEATTSKGRALFVELHRWNDLKIRSKNGHCMKAKPFDLVGVKIVDAKTGELVFSRDLFFGIFGKRKKEVSIEEAYQDYRHRYDIEPSFRFNKQNMFLDSYDCEEAQHFDNFLLVNQLANWLLYVAADEVEFIPRKWEQNKTKPKPKPDKLSISKTYRSTEKLFSTFEKEPFLPKTSKKGKGKIKKKRIHYKVVKKTKIKPPS